MKQTMKQIIEHREAVAGSITAVGGTLGHWMNLIEGIAGFAVTIGALIITIWTLIRLIKGKSNGK